MRAFGANQVLPTSGTRVDFYESIARLTQYNWGTDFLLGHTDSWLSGSVTMAPVRPRKTVLDWSTMPPVRLVPGLVKQAYWNARFEGALETPNCRASNGAYVIHEVEYSADGSLVKLAADYSVACTTGWMTHATGVLRYHSTVPAALAQTYAIAGLDYTVTEGDRITLDGTLSWNPGSRIKTLSWKQLSGPALDLSACQNGVCNSYAPLVAPGGATAVLELTALAESGTSASTQLRLKIRSWADTQSRANLFGSGHVASGADLRFTEEDGAFFIPVKGSALAVYPSQTIERVDIEFQGNATYGYAATSGPRFVLSNTLGQPLLPGQYAGTTRAGFEPKASPGFEASYDSHACNTPIWEASVAALDRDPADLTQISRAAIWFRINCAEGGLETEGSFGRFWINYTPVKPPQVRASGPVTAAVGDRISLRDDGSTTPAGEIFTRGWRQVFGPTVENMTLGPDGSALVTPAASTPDGSKLVFAHEVIDTLGQSGVALVTVIVKGGPKAQSAAGGVGRSAWTRR